MATVIGLFDNEATMTHASDALNQRGLGEDVVEVIDHATPSTDTGVIGAPVLSSPQYDNAVVRISDLPKALADADMSSAGKDFFAQRLEGGARMIILETEDVSKAKGVLQEHGASRLYPE